MLKSELAIKFTWIWTILWNHACFHLLTWQHCPDSWSAGRSSRSDQWMASPPEQRTYSPPLWPPCPSSWGELLSLWAAPPLSSSVRTLLEGGHELDVLKHGQTNVLFVISWTYCRRFSCGVVWLSAAPGSSEGEFLYRFPETFAVKTWWKHILLRCFSQKKIQYLTSIYWQRWIWIIFTPCSVLEQSGSKLLCTIATTQSLLLPYHPIQAGTHGLEHTIISWRWLNLLTGLALSLTSSSTCCILLPWPFSRLSLEEVMPRMWSFLLRLP